MTSDLHKAAEQAERNRERLHAWRQKYFELFGVWPDGDVRRHRRRCFVQSWGHYWHMMTSR